nr:hypothetical protein [Tanacetum cinerariifolium]
MAILLEYEEQPESIKKPFNSVLDTAEPLKLVGYVKEKLDAEEKKRKKKSNGVGLKVENKRVKEGEKQVCKCNSFSGPLPVNLSLWNNPSVLNQSNNDYSGSISLSIASLTHLTALSLANNSLSGEILDFRIMVGLLGCWFESGKCVELYDKMRGLDLVSSVSCYGSMVDYLVCKGEHGSVLRVYDNMVRGLTPHKNSYNAVISAVSKQGLWNHANDIVLEMEDGGVIVDKSNFRVLLAGYCKSRQFDEVKMTIKKMANKSLIELSPLQDPIAKAFCCWVLIHWQLHNEIDKEPLNLLVQAHINMGFVDKAKKVYNEMIKKNLKIKNKTYSAIVTSVCKKRTQKTFTSGESGGWECGEGSGVHRWRRVENVVVRRMRYGGVMVVEDVEWKIKKRLNHWVKGVDFIKNKVYGPYITLAKKV